GCSSYDIHQPAPVRIIETRLDFGNIFYRLSDIFQRHADAQPPGNCFCVPWPDAAGVVRHQIFVIQRPGANGYFWHWHGFITLFDNVCHYRNFTYGIRAAARSYAGYQICQKYKIFFWQKQTPEFSDRNPKSLVDSYRPVGANQCKLALG